jgi:GMP synthase-like glutamine amidotransferase
MHVQVVQHVPFEEPGLIAEWATAHGHSLGITRAWADEFPPPSHDVLLVVLGGPMGAADDEALQWLRSEKHFIAETISVGAPVLGVCLGAQIIATVIGGSIRRNRETEIGWYPVMLTPGGSSSPLFSEWPEATVVGHWHGDTFELPDGMQSLLSSAHCRNQAFVFDGRVVGLQFHLEWTPSLLANMVEACAEEFAEPGDAITPAAELLAGIEAGQAERRELLFALLDRLAQAARPHAEEVAHD